MAGAADVGLGLLSAAASGWEALGKSKGYSRHYADFYVPNDRPKKIWV